MDLGIGRDTDGVSNISSGGVSFSIEQKHVENQHKHANDFSNRLFSETKHNTNTNEQKCVETELKTNETVFPILPVFPFPCKQTFYPSVKF